MTLTDGQYAYRGLTFGSGTEHLVTSAEGLEGLDIRSGDQLLPRGHGAVPGSKFAAPKQPVLSFAHTGTVEQLDVLWQTLADTFAVQETPAPLTWKRAGQVERLMYVAPLMTAPDLHRAGVRRPKVALAAADPRIYSSELHDTALTLYSASGGGFELPTELPWDFSAGLSLDTVVANAGTAEAWPTVRVFGPTDGGTLTAFTVQNLSTGQSLTVTTPIAAGQVLTFDGTAWKTGSGAQVVGLDGASRYGSWEPPRVPLGLVPGDNVIRLTTVGTSTAVLAIVSHRHTWLS